MKVFSHVDRPIGRASSPERKISDLPGSIRVNASAERARLWPGTATPTARRRIREEKRPRKEEQRPRERDTRSARGARRAELQARRPSGAARDGIGAGRESL